MKKLFLSLPHSGEQIAEECTWLSSLAEPHLMRDVDRYVDKIYQKAWESNQLKICIAKWHRYVVDLNRLPTDIDQFSVEGAQNDLGRFSKKGVHWQETTWGEPLLDKPMSQEMHMALIQKYYTPWYDQVESLHQEIHQSYDNSYQLDCHSMPSVATAAHADPGSMRPEVVISDFLGKSCSEGFLNLVLGAFQKEFSEVSYNHPYIGGRITESFGQPERGRHCIQIELRRNLYMDEDSKKPLVKELNTLQEKIKLCIDEIAGQIGNLP